jgi:hypothetical protein
MLTKLRKGVGFIEVFLNGYVDQSFIFLFYALLCFYAVSNGVARLLGSRVELSPLPPLEECINSKEFTFIEFPYIRLSNLKFVECRKLFYFFLILCCLFDIVAEVWQHHSAPSYAIGSKLQK